MAPAVARVVGIVLLLAALLGLPRSPEVAASAPGIAWQPCATSELPTQECGTLDVPLDYDEPDGPTISLAVVRATATDQAGRIGSLIMNPGGPGGSGTTALPLMDAALPAPLPARFDVVTFDPRGVGQSAPVR